MTSHPVIHTALDIRPVQTARAFEEIALQLRSLISSGKLKPGDRLPSERDLAALFNVSRNTLREALRSLEISGMIELRKGIKGGAFVLPGDPSVVVGGFLDLYHLGAITPAQLTEARIWVEDLVVRVACEHATEADLATLEANIDATERAMKTRDMDAWIDELLIFHSLLGKATHNPIMIIVMEAIIKITRQFIDAIGPQLARTVVPSRRRLLAHLRARDAAAAGAEMTEHLQRLHRQYLSQLKLRAREAADA